MLLAQGCCVLGCVPIAGVYEMEEAPYSAPVSEDVDALDASTTAVKTVKRVFFAFGSMVTTLKRCRKVIAVDATFCTGGVKTQECAVYVSGKGCCWPFGAWDVHALLGPGEWIRLALLSATSPIDPGRGIYLLGGLWARAEDGN